MRTNGGNDRNVIVFANKIKANLKLKCTFNHQVEKTVIRSRLDGKRILPCSYFIFRQRNKMMRTRKSKFQDPTPIIPKGLIGFLIYFFFLYHKTIRDMWMIILSSTPKWLQICCSLMITDSVWKHSASKCVSCRGQAWAYETKFCRPAVL